MVGPQKTTVSASGRFDSGNAPPRSSASDPSAGSATQLLPPTSFDGPSFFDFADLAPASVANTPPTPLGGNRRQNPAPGARIAGLGGAGPAASGLGTDAPQDPDHPPRQFVPVPGGPPITSADIEYREPWVCYEPSARDNPHVKMAGAPRPYLKSTGQPVPDEFAAAAAQLRDSWTRTAHNGFGIAGDGNPTTITWSIAPSTAFILNGGTRWTAGANTLRSWLNSQIGSQEVWQQLMQDVFDRWSEISGLRFVYEPNDDGAPFDINEWPGLLGVRGDIRIGARPFRSGSSVIAVNYYPSAGGEMVMNSASTYTNNPAGNWRNFRNVFAHEIGHGIGLEHVCPLNRTKLMEPIASDDFDGQQFDEMYSAQTLYGDALEDSNEDSVSDRNDSIDTAYDLGELGVGTVGFENLSLDSVFDRDYFRFTLPPGSFQISISMRPQGNSYLEGPQAGNGDCGPGSIFDALRQQNLFFSIVDDAGEVLTTRNLTGIGFAENLFNFTMPPTGGPFYIRADGSNVFTQIYDIDFTISAVALPVLSVADPVVQEGGIASFFLNLDKPGVEEITADYRFEHDTTDAGDFESDGPLQLVLPAGTTSKTIRIRTTNDELDEVDENFRIIFSNTSGVAGSAGAVATVIDNDDPPEMSLVQNQLTSEGEHPMVEVELSEVSGREIGGTFTITPGPGAGSDFTTTTGTLNVVPGGTTGHIDIPLLNDGTPELPKTFSIEISELDGATLGTATANVTFIDDDTTDLLIGYGGVQITALPAGGIELSWGALPGIRYMVEYTDDFLGWQVLPGSESILADSANPSVTDASSPTGTRHYRITQIDPDL